MVIPNSSPVDYVYSDFLSLARDLRGHRARWRKWLEVGILASLAMGIGSLLLVGGPIGWDVWPGLIILPIFFIILPRPFVQARIMAWQYRRNPMRGAQQFASSVDGLSINSRHGDSVIRWASLHAIREHDDVLLIYLSPKCAYLIPSRVFQNEGDFRQFADQTRDFFEDSQRVTP